MAGKRRYACVAGTRTCTSSTRRRCCEGAWGWGEGRKVWLRTRQMCRASNSPKRPIRKQQHPICVVCAVVAWSAWRTQAGWARSSWSNVSRTCPHLQVIQGSSAESRAWQQPAWCAHLRCGRSLVDSSRQAVVMTGRVDYHGTALKSKDVQREKLRKLHESATSSRWSPAPRPGSKMRSTGSSARLFHCSVQIARPRQTGNSTVDCACTRPLMSLRKQRKSSQGSPAP